MSFFDKIYDIAYTDLFKYVFHSGRDKEFVANVSKIVGEPERLWELLKDAVTLCVGFGRI